MNPRSSKYKRFYDMNFNARRFRSSPSKEKFNGIMQTQRSSKKLQQWCETLSARFYAKNSLTEGIALLPFHALVFS